ncbi:MAG: winged helix-turn-helix domain-containing protein [Candidatus Hodarchaeota archaeon]
MGISQVVKNFLIRSINLVASILILTSLSVKWTINQAFFQLIQYIIPNGWLFIITGAILNIIGVLAYFFIIEKKGYTFFLQFLGIGMVIFVFLIFTYNYADFMNQLAEGYFLCGLGLILSVLEILFFILKEISLDSIDAEKKKEEQEKIEGLEKKFFEALNHEARRKILRMIGEKGFSTFTEFKQTLDIGTGTLYHHLKILSPLIYQTDDKKYCLNKLGELTRKFMDDNLPYLKSVDPEKPRNKSLEILVKRLQVLKMEKLFKMIDESNPKKTWTLIFIPIGLFFFGALAGFQNNFFFFATYSLDTSANIITPFLQLPGFFIQAMLSWLLIWAIIEGLTYINFKKKGNYLKSFIGTGICSFPIFIYEMFIFILKIADITVSQVVSGFMLVLTQTVTIFMLTSFFMIHDKLKIEKALSVIFPTYNIALFLGIILLLVL